MKNTIKGFFSKKPYYEPDKDQKNIIEKAHESFFNKALDIYKNRRSIRRFSSAEIDEKVIYNILEASMNAPCAGNIQNYEVIVVRDEKKRCQIGKIALQQGWIGLAPVVLVVLRDDDTIIELYPTDGNRYSIQNVAAFVNNILTFAHYSGLGACWVEACENSVLKNFLDIPEGKKVDAIIPIGYSLENPEQTKEPVSRKIYFETYGNFKK